MILLGLLDWVVEGLCFSDSPSSDPALRSRSSRRRLSFLPIEGGRMLVNQPRRSSIALEVVKLWSVQRRTVVALGNAVLYSAALSKVGDLSPILIGVGRAAESAAGAIGRVSGWRGSWNRCRAVGVRVLL